MVSEARQVALLEFCKLSLCQWPDFVAVFEEGFEADGEAHLFAPLAHKVAVDLVHYFEDNEDPQVQEICDFLFYVLLDDFGAELDG
ncbi:pre-rRNA-processing protein TSR2, partial [Kipferlia bialata]|eukprot:g11236.t1